MSESIIISVLVFSAVLLVLYALYNLVKAQSEKRRIVEKIERGGAPDLLKSLQDESAVPSGGIKKHFIDLATRLGQSYAPKSEEQLSHRKKKLIVAGFRRQNAAVVFYGTKIVFAVLLPLVFYPGLFLSGTAFSATQFLIIGVVLALFGFYLPDLILNVIIARRQEQIVNGFPDALDLMVVCVEAGMGMGQAIKRISDEMQLSNRIISEEFGLMNLELRAGRSRQDAMRNLAARTDVEEVRNLVTLLIQTDKFGTSVAHALRVHSDTMRTKRRQRAEETATKLPVKLLVPLLLFILPCLFVVMIGPGAINIYRALINN